MINKKSLILSAFGACMAIGGLAASATTASATVVCNREGDCWHTDTRYRYPGPRVTYHPDEWYFHQTWNDRNHWREYHEGRGYWRGGVWVTF